MFPSNQISGIKGMLLAGVLAGGIFIYPAGAQSDANAAAKPATAVAHARYQNSRFSRRAQLHYGLVWGVDSLNVKWTESGEVIRFTWRVLNATKAKALSDKNAKPALVDPKAGVSLVVPSLEKVGQLRQSGTPVTGKAYWMAFSNKGKKVQRGDRVTVVIGNFRADGLIVD